MAISKIKKVLVVEDEISQFNALVDKFKLEGFRVLGARNGEEGFTVALREHPDAIVLDIVMPDVNGLTMLKNLQSDVWGRTAKVIVLTNLGDSETISEAKKYGASYYLVKTDWKIEDVVKKVKEKLTEK